MTISLFCIRCQQPKIATFHALAKRTSVLPASVTLTYAVNNGQIDNISDLR